MITPTPAISFSRNVVRAVGVAVLFAFGCPCSEAAAIVPAKRYPSNDEQYTLQLMNRARLSADGLSILRTLVSNNLDLIVPSTSRNSRDGTPFSKNFWTSSIPEVASTMNGLSVHPGDLKRQYLDLDIPGYPLVWMPALGNVAAGYDRLVIASKGVAPGDPHHLAPYQDQSTFSAFAKRYLDGGYGPESDLAALGENIAANNPSNAATRFAAFMVDWGQTPDGIQDQNPDTGSHRLSIMASYFREVGISAAPGWDAGKVSEVQEFGDRFSVVTQLTGAVFVDTDFDAFYSKSEGLGGVRITATPLSGGATIETVTYRNGGYGLDLPIAGVYRITATGGFGVIDAGLVTIAGKSVLLNIASAKGQKTTDFNQDDKPDLALYDPSTRRTFIWYLDRGLKTGTIEGPNLSIAPVGWTVAGVADFNADGYPDYCLYNTSTHQTVIWYLRGYSKVDRADGPTIPSGWSIAAIEDFNRDGHPDYLLYNGTTRNTSIWYLHGPTKIGNADGPSLSITPTGWRVVGAADFDADGKPDLVLYNLSTRAVVIWYLDDNIRVARADAPGLGSTTSGYTLAGTGDFNGDNWPDFLLYDTATRKTVIWFLRGVTKFDRADGPLLPSGYQIIGP